MNLRMFPLAVLLVGAVLVTAQAQQPMTTGPSKDEPKQSAQKTTADDPMAEEIEIMRRLLDRTLEKQQHGQIVGTPAVITNLSPYTTHPYDIYYPQYSPPNNSSPLIPYLGPDSQGRFLQPYQPNTSSPYGWNLNSTYNPALWTNQASAPHAPPELRAAQGVYLKGYGVVYTATVALPTAPPVADVKKIESKPLTDWERTRLELHGEKAEPAKTTPQDTLADAVLKVLAKNGQHFSQLAETEQITVALTLPRAESCTQCHVKAKGNVEPKRTGSTSTGNSSPGTPTSGAVPKELVEKISALKKDAEKAALLGDLHVKQGKNDQAAASFQEALKLYLAAAETLSRARVDLKGIPVTDLKDAQLEQDLVATAAKALQALTAQGKTDEAKTMLKSLDQHLQKAAPAETSTKTPEGSAKVELPAKVVISAPKKLLDMVGSEKITFEEFRKNATVEYQPARTIEKQASKP